MRGFTFQQMLQDARAGAFDAIVVHKWDRLARLRFDAVRYKVTLRREYGIKLFVVEGVSEDEDEYIGMFFEAMTEVWGELYSRNLSRETQKGKYEKAHQGKHNNRASFGADQTREGVLRPNPKEQPGLMLAMESYATSTYPMKSLHKKQRFLGRGLTRKTRMIFCLRLSALVRVQ